MKETTKSANMHVRVNPEVKERAMLVLEDMGVSLSDLFNLLLNQVAIQHRIPFEIVDNSYVCAYGYKHDYSKTPPEGEYSEPFGKLGDLWRTLDNPSAPNAETLAAMREGDKIIKSGKTRFNGAEDMLRELKL